MKHYAEIVPLDLTKELKAAGIHPLNDVRMEGWLNSGYNITYAEVFDWFFFTYEAYVDVFLLRVNNEWRYCGCVQGWEVDMTLGWRRTWYEAANAAIEKALTLI